jgi:hypothetical protein
MVTNLHSCPCFTVPSRLLCILDRRRWMRLGQRVSAEGLREKMRRQGTHREAKPWRTESRFEGTTPGSRSNHERAALAHTVSITVPQIFTPRRARNSCCQTAALSLCKHVGNCPRCTAATRTSSPCQSRSINPHLDSLDRGTSGSTRPA